MHETRAEPYKRNVQFRPEDIERAEQIMRATGVSNVTEAIRYALKRAADDLMGQQQ